MAPDAHFSPLRISVEAVNQFIYLWRFKLSFAYSILSFLKSPFSVSLDSNLSELSVQCFPIWLFRSFSLSHSPFDETPDGMTKKLCLKWRRSERDWNVKRWNVILSWLRKQKKVLQVWNFISNFHLNTPSHIWHVTIPGKKGENEFTRLRFFCTRSFNGIDMLSL